MLSRLKGMETLTWRDRIALHCLKTLWICFPVWREWKQFIALVNGVFAKFFGYAFPFEGNGNTSVWCFRTTDVSLDMLSRLKGIETFRAASLRATILFTLDMLSRLKGIETFSASSVRGFWLSLWICFPVWRKWKLASLSLIRSFLGLNVFG